MKTVVCVMGQNCKDYLEICLESCKEADAIVYCDGGSTDISMELCALYSAEVIQNSYSQDDPLMNGKQRSFYLKHLKENYEGWLAICLDADEVLAEGAIKEIVSYAKGFKEKTVDHAFSPRMRHLVGDFSHEDSTVPVHYVQNRVFFVSESLFYPEGEHVILQSKKKLYSLTIDDAVVWHLAYAPMFHVRDRYRKNLQHSNVHSKQFLASWYRSHLFGMYPKQKFDVRQLPTALLKSFDIDPDEIYFNNRGLETKHFLDAVTWRDYFKPESVYEVGAGLGPRVLAMNSLGMNARGVELSRWAVDNALDKNVEHGNILEQDPKNVGRFDLVVAYDVLEHLEEQDLTKALAIISSISKKHLLVSVPVVGDPNLDADPTHKIRETKHWWVQVIESFGFELKETPDNFLYKEQVMIYEVLK